MKKCISIRISLKIPNRPVDNKAACIGSGNGLAPNRRQAITWTKADPVYRRTYGTRVIFEYNARSW